MKTNEILKELRTAKGLSQADMAVALDVSLSSYQKYERDKNCITPSLDVLTRIADYYGVSVDFLLGRGDNKADLINMLLANYNVTELEKEIITNYMDLPPQMRKELIKYIKGMIKAAENDNV